MRCERFCYFFAVVFTTALSCFADSLERFSPDFSTNTVIAWQAPTNDLPKYLWIYKRLPPRPFSASIISNAVILASLQDKKIPEPSTNSFFIWSAPNPCGMSFSLFSIQPASATISFSSTNQNLSANEIPDDKTVAARAFEYAAQFSVSRTNLIPKKVYASQNAAGCDETLTNGICARGIFLSRKLDGFGFLGDEIDGREGFEIEFGSRGQIRSFSFVWPNLKRAQKSITASPEEMIRRIRSRGILIWPEKDEENYFDRIKSLASAKTFTVTKITPCYIEGIFGEDSTNDDTPQFIAPLAELEAVANFGNSNVTVRLLSPIISLEASRLVGTNSTH